MDKGTNAHHQSLTNDCYGMTFVAATVQHVVFKDTSRMSKTSFDKLLLFIRRDLEVDASRARCCGGIILPELCLYCTLQYCAGGLYSDIKNFTSISTASFYCALFVFWVLWSRRVLISFTFLKLSMNCSLNKNIQSATDGTCHESSVWCWFQAACFQLVLVQKESCKHPTTFILVSWRTVRDAHILAEGLTLHGKQNFETN